jgi:hypothetical protein
MENATLGELMERIKLLDNEQINMVMQYCRIMKKANDVKDGKKSPRKKRTKNTGA